MQSVIHREVDLPGMHIKENVCSYFQYNPKHCYGRNTRSSVSEQTWLHNEPDWMIAFHVQHTSAQCSLSRISRYLKICIENNRHIWSLKIKTSEFTFLVITLYAFFFNVSVIRYKRAEKMFIKVFGKCGNIYWWNMFCCWHTDSFWARLSLSQIINVSKPQITPMKQLPYWSKDQNLLL